MLTLRTFCVIALSAGLTGCSNEMEPEDPFGDQAEEHIGDASQELRTCADKEASFTAVCDYFNGHTFCSDYSDGRMACACAGSDAGLLTAYTECQT